MLLLITPQPCQFTCLAVDLSGEVVCAGCMDPFNIYVWSLQTGRLLDVLTGHEGPIACLDFSPTSSTLASGSWDGTLKLWDVYKNSCIETMEHGCDVMAVAFRPDGKEICTSATNGNLYIWEVETGQQVGLIRTIPFHLHSPLPYPPPLSCTSCSDRFDRSHIDPPPPSHTHTN